MDNEEFLKKIELFSGISPKYLKAMGRMCSERRFAEGKYLVRQGEEGVGIFIIVSGRVKVISIWATRKSVAR